MGLRVLFFIALVAINCTIGWLVTWEQEAPANNRVQPEYLRVPAREVPIPTTVSSELAKVIARPIAKLPVFNTDAQWRFAQQAAATNDAQQVQKLSADLGVTVEKRTIHGVQCFSVTPAEVPATNRDRLLVHVHGGAYVFGGGRACAEEAILVAAAAKMPALSIDYRMPPDHPFPAAIDDTVAVWKEVTENRDPAKMALFGTSAGGGLTMASVLKFKEEKLPLPGALFLGTPWTDLTKTGDTFFTNAGLDNSLDRYDGFLEACAKLYAGKTELKDPLLSPIYGDVEGFPPTILISGTRDLFLSITIRAHRKLRAAGVDAALHVYEGQSHADYLKSYPSPEAKDALNEVARFLAKHLKQ